MRNTLVSGLVFLVVTPLITFLFLVLKGLPSFTAGHEIDALLWVYSVTGWPALLSGFLFSILGLRRWNAFFTHPYDIGRCVSAGLIVGAIVEGFSTHVFRILTHHPFSSFWIAGAAMAGSLTGLLTAPFLFRHSAKLNR